jgi:ATP-binding cassette subfamily F protein 3
VLFVSHDRYFIDGLATRVFEVEERRVHIYPGNYEDYMYRKGGGAPASQSEAAARLKTDAATGATVDAATGMLKPVKQVGKAEPPPAPKDILPTPEEALAFDTVASTHEVNGSLAPVTPTPKLAVKRLNPHKLKQIEDRVGAIEGELPDLEARIHQATQQQANYTTSGAARALVAELEELRSRHTTLTAEWEELSMQLEEQATA